MCWGIGERVGEAWVVVYVHGVCMCVCVYVYVASVVAHVIGLAWLLGWVVALVLGVLTRRLPVWLFV